MSPTETRPCPCGHGTMKRGRTAREISFRNTCVSVDCDLFICESCGLEASLPESAGNMQLRLSEAYKSMKGLVTAEELKKSRASAGLTVDELGQQAGIPPSEITGWENGQIQSDEADQKLRSVLFP